VLWKDDEEEPYPETGGLTRDFSSLALRLRLPFAQVLHKYACMQIKGPMGQCCCNTL
jgi:hypothetical protein